MPPVASPRLGTSGCDYPGRIEFDKTQKAQETFVSTLLALRSYRHQFSVLPKSEDETLAFSPAISPASSFVKAKHFLPRSFRDAPIR